MRYQRWVAAGISEEHRVLDLGCGRGGIVERLGSVGSWTGTDPDLNSLIEHRRPALSRCCAQSEHLPCTAATFDTVVASWVLEHLPNPEQTFREIARLSRGAYCPFDAGSAKQLRELLTAVAVYATGGRKALKDFSDETNSGAALRLLEQLG